jgi:hypothetical protein
MLSDAQRHNAEQPALSVVRPIGDEKHRAEALSVLRHFPISLRQVAFEPDFPSRLNGHSVQ